MQLIALIVHSRDKKEWYAQNWDLFAFFSQSGTMGISMLESADVIWFIQDD